VLENDSIEEKCESENRSVGPGLQLEGLHGGLLRGNKPFLPPRVYYSNMKIRRERKMHEKRRITFCTRSF